MYPTSVGALAPGHHGYQRAFDLIICQASSGPLGSPVFDHAGKTGLHCISTSRRPRQEIRLIYIVNSSAGFPGSTAKPLPHPDLCFSGATARRPGQGWPSFSRRHNHRLFQATPLTMVVKSLGNVSTISAHLADLGRRHASYDVTEEHYVYVGQALLLMLRRLLGPSYTEEIQDAWSAAYNMLARMMLPTSNFFGRLVRGVMTSQYGVSEFAAPSQEQATPKPSTLPVRKVRSF